jgi:hypothetical protein
VCLHPAPRHAELLEAADGCRAMVERTGGYA